MRHISLEGLNLIKHFEGFSAVPYRDSAGLWTIGYGHLIGKGEVFHRIEEAEALELLSVDVQQAERAVLRMIGVSLTNEQFAALVSFTFNVGAGALQRSTLRQKVNRQEHVFVPEEFMRWIWAGGRKVRGLVFRRQREAELYAS